MIFLIADIKRHIILKQGSHLMAPYMILKIIDYSPGIQFDSFFDFLLSKDDMRFFK